MSNVTTRGDRPLDLGSLLFGAARREVLALLLLHPESSLHVRELARLTGKVPGTLLRELKPLADVGILVRTRIGNQVHFHVNPACPIFEGLRGIMKKTSGIADVLRQALEPLGSRITVQRLSSRNERAGSSPAPVCSKSCARLSKKRSSSLAHRKQVLVI